MGRGARAESVLPSCGHFSFAEPCLPFVDWNDMSAYVKTQFDGGYPLDPTLQITQLVSGQGFLGCPQCWGKG